MTPQELREFADALRRLVDMRRELGELAERTGAKEGAAPGPAPVDRPNVEEIAQAVREIVWGRHPGNN